MDRKDSTSSIGEALQRVESYQYPNTHVGHLSQGQSGALAKFRDICQQKGYYKPATAGHEASHDDETLLRYLRARKFVPQEAFGQFKDTEDWRKTNKIEELYETIDVTEYDETRRLYPQWTGRRDKRGIPVYVFEVAHLTAKRMSVYEKSISSSKSFGSVPPKLMRLFALYENLTVFTLPLCSGVPNRPYSETPVSQSNNIVDISGVGLKQFWNLKQHMQDASTLATAHYPETLDRIFIIGAPSFFPTVWGWVKRWFDPITVSKIFILGQAEVKPTLEKYIDPANIPKKYGGQLDWEWGTTPNLDAAISDSFQWEHAAKDERGKKNFPMGPVKWSKNSNGDMVATAVGTDHGKSRRQVVGTMPTGSDGAAKPSTQTPKYTRTKVSADPSDQFGPPSTTGVYSHPNDEQNYFPSSGVTPPDEHEDPYSKAFSLPNRDARNTISTGTTSDSTPQQRGGTSTARYWQQDPTYAQGHSTPEVLDHGYGDKTSTIETRTVGQAPKDVNVPEAQADEGAADTSYLGQAKAVANSAYTNATAVIESAEHTVLAAVGYGQPAEEKSEEHVEPQRKAEDPRVDKMKNQDVEEFIRSKYTTHHNS